MNRNEILDRVNSYDLLAYYLAPYHNQGRLIQGKHISNPFLSNKQDSPSFNIFYDMIETKEWRFKDFATGDAGSCFDLVMRLFNLSFTEAKQKICTDFNIEQLESKGWHTASAPVNESEISTEFSLETHAYTEAELAFWLKYGITAEVLQRYQVKAVAKFTATNKKGKAYQNHSNPSQPIFAYDFSPQWAKIYKPADQKNHRFQYLGNKPGGFVFGLDQLPEKGEILILTGGEKDVLSLATRGYFAITLNSETARPGTELLQNLRNRFSHLMVLYDNDQTGRDHSEVLSKLFGFIKIQLPEITDGKDISDFFAAGATCEDLNDLINDALKKASEERPANFANIADFASFANEAEDPTISVEAEDELSAMPYLPDWIFNQLPDLLKKGSAVFEDRRERDIFLLSALGILSGCINQVSGSYNGKTCHANLYVFVIAPAASGKGSLFFARKLGEKLHESFVQESERQKKIYQMELQHYKQKVNDKSSNLESLEPPQEPPYKVLFFPANSSSARIIELLKESDHQGIFCETEADSMGNVLKQDWGGYSDLLRKAFHHEPISYSRKTNKAFIEIGTPQLTVVLAGTPGQIEGLFKSAEDGLVSRFLFYNFKSPVEWRDAGPTLGGVNLNQHFDGLSAEVLRLAEFLATNGEATFHLRKEQWDKLNDFGRECIGDVVCFVSEDMSSTAKRFGTILLRLSMILTVLRYYEYGEIAGDFHCSDEDFSIALALMEVLREHAVYTFRKLPKNGEIMDIGLKRFFNALPDDFQRKDAIALAETKFTIPERTADSWLARLKSKKLIENTRSGIYRKTRK